MYYDELVRKHLNHSVSIYVISVVKQPLIEMTPIHQRHEILESLNSLDQRQAEKVLEFIKGLVYTTPDEASYKQFKREAMKEIRHALGKGRQVRPAF